MNKSESKKRIAVFTKQLDNWRSGSGHHLNEIMARVLDLNQDRFDFTFIHYVPSVNPIYKRVRELIVPRNPLRSAVVLRKERFDLVHYTPLTIFAPIWFVPNRKVATIHGVEQLLIPQFFGKLEMFHERVLVPIYARRMDGILSVSQTTKDYLVDNFGVQAKKIEVAYNGIGDEYKKLNKNKLKVCERYGVQEPFIFHISRFSERKNPWTLLKSFARFLQLSGISYSLVCAGSGWDSAEVKQRATELGIADKLFTPGFISERDVAELMNQAECFVFPSLAEGFGMPNAEAMASHCPVITSAAFAVPEIVGDAAIVIQDPMDVEGFAQAMLRLCSNPSLKAELIERGLARLPLFSWEEAGKKLFGLYEKILA